MCNVKNIIMWSLTYRCNMHCEYCFLKEKIKCWEELTDNECIELANKIASDNSWRADAIWLTGGEPTIRKCLPELISIFESNGIRCVITTNGFCGDETLSRLLESKPRGINVSLESIDDEENSKVRGNTEKVVDCIKKIAQNKAKNTILGVSSVVSPENIGKTLAFSKEIQKIGVEYLSINPLIGGNGYYTAENFAEFREMCCIIKAEKNIKLPNDFYFNLVEDFFLDKRKYNIPCPAGDSYMFIAPWGSAYPCSNEMWQSEKRGGVFVQNQSSLKQVFESLKQLYDTDSLTTRSSCFGERCIGCWKLYYDTIFTE